MPVVIRGLTTVDMNRITGTDIQSFYAVSTIQKYGVETRLHGTDEAHRSKLMERGVVLAKRSQDIWRDRGCGALCRGIWRYSDETEGTGIFRWNDGGVALVEEETRWTLGGKCRKRNCRWFGSKS
jgi:hypothetical protein